MFYYVIFALLLISTMVELFDKDKKNILFFSMTALLTCMLCFRYGLGSDYFGYCYNYMVGDVHSEVGYNLLTTSLHSLGVPYQFFVAAVGLFCMLCTARGIYRFSPYRSFSLLLLFHTLYMTYFFSAMRQGIVMAFFIGFLVGWLMDGKYGRYIVACVVLSFFHSCALTLIPLVLIKKLRIRWFLVGLGAAVLLGTMLYFMPQEWFSFIQIGSFGLYLQILDMNPNIMGILERTALFGIASVLYFRMTKAARSESAEQIEMLYKICFVGYIVSMVCFPWGFYSSRLGITFKAIEVLLIPALAYEEKDLIKKGIVAAMICYVGFMLTKNLSAYAGESNMNGVDSPFKYPYISVFDKDKKMDYLMNDTYYKKLNEQ